MQTASIRSKGTRYNSPDRSSSVSGLRAETHISSAKAAAASPRASRAIRNTA